MSTMTRTIVILALFVFVVVSVVPGTIGDSGSRCRNCLKTINENVLHVSDALDHVNTRLDALSKCHQTAQKPDPSKNIALNRPAYQSSTLHYAYAVSAAMALDANRYTTYTHTNLQQSPWWAVDLGSTYTIHHIKVTNRRDCCGYRLKNFDVRLGQTLEDVWNNKNMQTCMYHNGAVGQGATKSLACTTRQRARFVKIQLRGRDYLTLCDVRVYAI